MRLRINFPDLQKGRQEPNDVLKNPALAARRGNSGRVSAMSDVYPVGDLGDLGRRRYIKGYLVIEEQAADVHVGRADDSEPVVEETAFAWSITGV